MFTSLVVPLDRSALAEQALGRAAAIARASNASIDVVLVQEPIADEAGVLTLGAARQVSDERYLRATVARLSSGAGVRATGALMEGPPADGICARARDVNASLIVMTSHGRTGFS